MFKKKVIPKCPVCGSQDVSPDLLMQCNCTKGMGRNLSYPRFRCRKCHTSFGDRKNRRTRDTVSMKYEFLDPSGTLHHYTIQANEHDTEYIQKENGKIIAEGILTNRQWKRFLQNFYDLYPLEWLNYDGESSEMNNSSDISTSKESEGVCAQDNLNCTDLTDKRAHTSVSNNTAYANISGSFADSNVSNNSIGKDNLEKVRWLLEIEFKDDSTEIRQGNGELPPYSNELKMLWSSQLKEIHL